jgi:hypothetical protein
MLRQSATVLYSPRPALGRLLPCLPLRFLNTRYVVRTEYTKARPRDKYARPGSAERRHKTLPPERQATHCSGCGVLLQFDDMRKAGYALKVRGKTRLRVNDVFDDLMQEVDETLQAKLQNTTQTLKELEEQGEVELRREEQEEDPIDDDDGLIGEATRTPVLNKARIPLAHLPTKIKERKPLCQRCHQIIFHSNPLNNTLPDYKIHKTISPIIQNIRETNHDPENPPLLVHVLDVADFPLSFIPFHVPDRSKVIFVVNRVDILCPRSSAMVRLQPYFRREIAAAMKDSRMSIRDYEIHPMSAKKGWGTKYLLERIFQLRNAKSNVYVIGTSF